MRDSRAACWSTHGKEGLDEVEDGLRAVAAVPFESKRARKRLEDLPRDEGPGSEGTKCRTEFAALATLCIVLLDGS